METGADRKAKSLLGRSIRKYYLTGFRLKAGMTLSLRHACESKHPGNWIAAQGRNDCHAGERRHPVNWIAAQGRNDNVYKNDYVIPEVNCSHSCENRHPGLDFRVRVND